MRIAIDARELTGRPTGVGRYLAGLLREWSAPAARHGHEFLLYTHQADGMSTWPCTIRTLPGSGGTMWEQRTLPAALAADRPDVLFSPAYSTPLFTRTPRVVALHDLSFVAHPEWFALREGVRRRFLARASAAAARAIVTISRFSRDEIVHRLRVRRERVHVVPPGIDPPSPVTPSGHAEGTHVLYVGSIFNRRHIPDLIAGFDLVALAHADASLHMVGDNRSHPHQDISRLIAARSTASRMHWHRYVGEGQLRQLYRQAHAFVFLSEYEGLGLTPLEALAAGVPPLLLDTPVARESCGPSALYVPACDARSVADALTQLLYDEGTRRALLLEAPSVLARYDWSVSARETLAVIEGAA
ncbi:MAG: glycosyltransferase family 4 protein [Vicinamibacterales bacterium]